MMFEVGSLTTRITAARVELRSTEARLRTLARPQARHTGRAASLRALPGCRSRESATPLLPPGMNVVRVAVVAVRRGVTTQARRVLRASSQRVVLLQEPCRVGHGDSVARVAEPPRLVARLARCRIVDRELAVGAAELDGVRDGDLVALGAESSRVACRARVRLPHPVGLLPVLAMGHLPWTPRRGTAVALANVTGGAFDRRAVLLVTRDAVLHDRRTRPPRGLRMRERRVTRVAGGPDGTRRVLHPQPVARCDALGDGLVALQTCRTRRLGHRASVTRANQAFGYIRRSSFAFWLGRLHAPLSRWHW